ncbi:MAG: hypothetical protein H6926_05530 [Chromatiales bacterium]|nr:hypothetical protein [Gammaproteobacteria bacterium]MCP5352629.1 hypothetical protein [Chromatiales bacterium]
MNLFDLLKLLSVAALMGAAFWIGRQIVINEELRELADDLNSGRSAVQSYLDRFGYLPGDDPTVSSRWGEVVPNGNGDGRIDGDWLHTGPIDMDEPGAIPESKLVWMHLRRARMWPGFIDGLRSLGLPANAAGGYMGVQSGNFGFEGVVVCLSGLDADAAGGLDQQLDDGRADTGYVRGARREQANAAAPLYSPAATYYLCRAL